MPLTSPGVEVTITDQSQYLPAPTNSVPFILLATAQNKANPNGTGVAQGTTAANAGKLYQVTSQRDLVTLYGTPFFYTATDGTPIQGYELNEYGLLAAYSALGVTNRAYVLRADIDLASLVGSAGRPAGNPSDGSWWLDTTTSSWGIYEFNATTGEFTPKLPIVINDPADMSGGLPLGSIGNIGDYAVYASEMDAAPTAPTAKQYFLKAPSNSWVALGTSAWLSAVPTVVGSNSNPTLTAGNTFTLTIDNSTATITVPVAPNNTVAGLAVAINALGWGYLSASVNSAGRLQLFVKAPGLEAPTSFAPNFDVVVAAGTGTVLADIGLAAGTYYQPAMVYGTSAQQPLWQSGQSTPRPTGSVWIKVGSAGNGLVPVVSQWNQAAAVWVPKTVTLSTSDWAATSVLDASGGQAIAANSVYGQYSYDDAYPSGPVYLWKRLASGPTIVTGTNTNPNFDSGPYLLYVQTSVPGSATLSSSYEVTIPDNATAVDFVTAWQAAGITYTQASVTSSGAIQLTHTEGGEIVMSDLTAAGFSNGALAEAGFVPGTTDGCKLGPAKGLALTPVAASGGGTGLHIVVVSYFGNYYLPSTSSFLNAGTGYSVGDVVTFAGADLGGTTPSNNLVVEVTSVGVGGAVTGITFVSGTAVAKYGVQLSNWVDLDYISNEGAPTDVPANLTNWFYSVVDQVDIMVKYNGAWRGYKNVGYDSNGFPTPSVANATDPNGPIVSASEPTTQSDNTALVYGDLWVSTADLENYPVIYRWQAVNGVDQWVLLDNTDQVSASGVLFADARWSNSGAVNPVNDPVPAITTLLSSNYIDLDCPSQSLYPTGMLLFNTRRSGYNVKQFRTNYFTKTNFPNAGNYDAGSPTNVNNLPSVSYTWVSASGLQSNGAPFMGRKAQRAMVVASMRSAIDTNLGLRDEDNFFNLQVCPGYPELQPNMVVLNSDRGETGYILGDTPMGLSDDATAIQAWATNAAGATSTGENGCVTRNTYLGLFYPSGIAPDLSGNLVAVPASHMMLRTFLRNDTIAYPWLAAAGTRRGIIDNATSIGYIDRSTGEFQVIKTRLGIRDVLYVNFINPLVFFTGNGLLNYGNKTSFNSQSALDRTNVARLVAYIRRQLTLAARPFVFEPNDALTRSEIAGVVESLMVDLVAKRGIYDYLVVCDESNNTPARIDRNELWVDVAVEPVKAAEFIYIPVRILNTGELS
jgi:hypothetical protein